MMLRIRLIIALTLSIALIVGAVWFRFVRIAPYSADIFSVPQTEPSAFESFDLTDFSGTTTPVVTTSTAPLSQTETVGRQLFSDYIGLISKGQTGLEDINQLAAKYADIMARFETKAINSSEITIVGNTPANFQTYADKVMTIRYKYKSVVETRVGTLDTLGLAEKNFTAFAKDMAALYPEAIAELKAVPTPVLLVSTHTQLINTYIGAAAAFTTAADDSRDPVETYAAFSAITKNSEQENETFLTLLEALMENGVKFAQES